VRRRGALGPLTALACAGGLLAGCTPASPPAASPSTGAGCPALSSTVRPTVDDAATRDRISGVLDAFARRAWNPTAPAVRPSRQQGGLYINYDPAFDGASSADTETNINTDGRSDDQAGKSPRHDPLADLAVLRDLDAAAAAGIRTSATERLRCRLQPVTAAEFTSYGPARGSVYLELADLSQLDPRGPWREEAHRFAATLATTFRDPPTLGGAGDKPQIRPDWVAASAEALVDAGSRFATPAWAGLGEQLAVALVTKAANPATGLFPSELEVDAARAVTVTDPLVRVGAEAQLLDALLAVADRTGNAQVRAAVAAGLAAVESPATGLVDTRHGGWFFAVDSDGTGLRTAYKETRSAWMVPLLQHAARRGLPIPAGAPARAERLVRDSMYLASSKGYVYRLAPDWTAYRDPKLVPPVAEDWVSSEATGIAVDVMLGDLSSES
jgi:hypothetical protein